MKKTAISSNTHPASYLFYLMTIWGLSGRNASTQQKERAKVDRGDCGLGSDAAWRLRASELQRGMGKLMAGSGAGVVVTDALGYWKPRRVLSSLGSQRWKPFCWSSHTDTPPPRYSHHTCAQTAACVCRPTVNINICRARVLLREFLSSSSLGGHLSYLNSNYCRREWIPEHSIW